MKFIGIDVIKVYKNEVLKYIEPSQDGETQSRFILWKQQKLHKVNETSIFKH